MGRDSLGLDEGAWNSLFDAFMALSRGWGEYAKTFKPERAKKATRTGSESEPGDKTWNPDSFYVALEDVKIELPTYFARVENSGWAIGDFEHLISALPTAGFVASEAPPGPSEDVEPPDVNVGAGEEGSEGGEEDENSAAGEDEAAQEQHRRLVSNRLFRKFRTLIGTYDASVEHPAETAAEATLVSTLYAALHVAFARAVTVRLLDTSGFRELSPRLIRSWTDKVWKPMPSKLRDEVECTTGCATITLAAISAATSPWAREHLDDQDEFDADMHKQLVATMRELRPFFLGLTAEFESGEIRTRWTKAAGEYGRLGGTGGDAVSRYQDLENRYEIWRLDEQSALQRELKKLGLLDTAALHGNVLRVHAPLPDAMFRMDHLRKLLYLIHDGVNERAAVAWSNRDLLGPIHQITLVLDPEQRAVVEAMRYAHGGCGLWRHTAISGNPAASVYLTKPSRSMPSRASSRSSADAGLIHRARELVPDLCDAPEA